MRQPCRGSPELAQPSLERRGSGARALVSPISLAVSLAWGCSGQDETRVDAVASPSGGAGEAQGGGRLEPEMPDAPTRPGLGAARPEPEEDEAPAVDVPGGAATDNRSRPWIEDLSDWRVLRGDGVLVSGGQLLPNPYVLLGNRAVVPLEASLTSLKFVVPADLELARCEVTHRLFVKTDNGLSAGVELAVLQHQPAIALADPRVSAGQMVSLRVEPKGAGVLELHASGRAGVRLALAPDGTSTIPAGTPAGPAILRWVTACGEAVTAIDVQERQTPP